MSILSFSSSILAAGTACTIIGESIDLYYNSKPEINSPYMDLAVKAGQVAGGILISSATLTIAGHGSTAIAALSLCATPLITRTVRKLSNNDFLKLAANTVEKNMGHAGNVAVAISSIALATLGFSFVLPTILLTLLSLSQILKKTELLAKKENALSTDETFKEEELLERESPFNRDFARAMTHRARDFEESVDEITPQASFNEASLRREIAIVSRQMVEIREELLATIDRFCLRMESDPPVARKTSDLIEEIKARQQALIEEVRARHLETSRQCQNQERSLEEFNHRLSEIQRNLMDQVRRMETERESLRSTAPVSHRNEEFALQLAQAQEELKLFQREVSHLHQSREEIHLRHAQAEQRADIKQDEIREELNQIWQRLGSRPNAELEETSSLGSATHSRPGTPLSTRPPETVKRPQQSAPLLATRFPASTPIMRMAGIQASSGISSGQKMGDTRFERIAERLRSSHEPNEYQLLFENEKFLFPSRDAGGKIILPETDKRISAWREVERRHNSHTDFYTQNFEIDGDQQNLLTFDKKIDARELVVLFKNSIQAYWRDSKVLSGFASSLQSLNECIFDEEVKMYRLIPEFIKAVAESEAFLKEVQEHVQQIIATARDNLKNREFERESPVVEETISLSGEQKNSETLDQIVAQVHA